MPEIAALNGSKKRVSLTIAALRDALRHMALRRAYPAEATTLIEIA
jgi:hypothetical protein